MPEKQYIGPLAAKPLLFVQMRGQKSIQKSILPSVCMDLNLALEPDRLELNEKLAKPATNRLTVGT